MRWNPFCNTPTQNCGLELCRVFHMKPNSALEGSLLQVSPQNLLARKREELGMKNEKNTCAMGRFAHHPFLKCGRKRFHGRNVSRINHFVFALWMFLFVSRPFQQGIVVVQRFKKNIMGRWKHEVH